MATFRTVNKLPTEELKVTDTVATGASSGIGLALPKHLLSRQWAVVTADINPPPADLGPSTLFVPCDVSSWEQQAALFARAFAWHDRLDFAALNAGIDDRDDIFASIDTTTSPREPNMQTFQTNFIAPYYGIKLCAHYMSRNAVPGGKIVVTASAAGLYALPAIPQYSATKHGLVGLTRSLAPLADRRASNITLNALCPAMVATGLAPPGLTDGFPAEHTTPMLTLLRAYDDLAHFGGVARDEWRTSPRRPNGCIVECTLAETHYRDPPEAPNGSHQWMSTGSSEYWAKAYAERNRWFAEMDWKAGSNGA
ncbi:hypothetical protein LTR60_003914 [Cryomyces antarcticus]|nr:hypothetical protein LTR60_003914 [Cryomyces antarcticus]